jgi:hypothetical protein
MELRGDVLIKNADREDRIYSFRKQIQPGNKER